MALVFRVWVQQSCGNGVAKGEVGYDDVSLAITRVRYSNTSTIPGTSLDFQLFKPQSESPDGTPIFEGAVPANTAETTRNIQNLGLALKPSRFDPANLVPDDWTIVTRGSG